MTTLADHPVLEVLADLKSALAAESTVILKAPPGAGKSTALPLQLLNEPWLAGKKIVMLEPRRLAAQSVAQRLAQQLGESVGATVGLRMRLVTKVSPQTRLEIITEGVMTRLLQADPELSNVGLVIFDEFHERSVHLDLALALCLDAKRVFNLSVKLLLMSATLDDRSLQSIFPNAPLITSLGRQFPVAVQHAKQTPTHLKSAVVGAIERAIAEHPGDVLVFLPGLGEIASVQRLLQEQPAEFHRHCVVYALYGNMPIEQQSLVVNKTLDHKRKIILATNVAETSVTIDGVRIVIDSGLARRARFDPSVGFTRLDVHPIARANLEQRRGRAGRTAPGVCVRLFTEADERQRAAFGAAEITEVDCAPLVLDVLEWGTPVNELPWVEAPAHGPWQQALQLLKDLDAIDDRQRLTPIGQAIRRFNAHPRLAKMMLAAPRALRRLACELAALLSERDLLPQEAPRDDNLLHRLDILRRGDHKAAKRALQVVAQFERTLEHTPLPPQESGAIRDAGSLLMLAYPDRIAKRVAPNRFALTQGTSAYFDHVDGLAQSEYLVIAQAQGSAQHPRVQLALAVDKDCILQAFQHHLQTSSEAQWDDVSQSVVRRSQQRLGALVLEERIARDLTDDEALPVLAHRLRAVGLSAYLDEPGCRHFIERCQFVKRALDPPQADDWPDFSEAELINSLDTWLMPFCNGVRRMEALKSVDWQSALRARLTHPQHRALDTLAPTSLTVPSGSQIRVDYGRDPPRIAVRLQEVFGLKETPRVAAGRVALAMELLSPARRPVQLTRDLGSFWQSGYHEVRKELKGRYPKHYWPDDPLQSEPTSRAKPRQS